MRFVLCWKTKHVKKKNKKEFLVDRRLRKWGHAFSVRFFLSRRYEKIQTAGGAAGAQAPSPKASFDFIAQHKACSLSSGASADQVTRLTRRQFGVYLVVCGSANSTSSRIERKWLLFLQRVVLQQLRISYVIDISYRLFIARAEILYINASTSCLHTLCWTFLKGIVDEILRVLRIVSAFKGDVFFNLYSWQLRRICHANKINWFCRTNQQARLIKGWKIVDDSGVFYYIAHFLTFQRFWKTMGNPATEKRKLSVWIGNLAHQWACDVLAATWITA